MPEYVAPKRDMEFVLFDLLDAQSTWQRIPALADVSRDLVTAVLEEAGKIASEQLAPLNQAGDRTGGVHGVPMQLRRHRDFKGAFSALAQGGWLGVAVDPQYGGQGLPKMLTVALEEMFYAANTGLYLCGTLMVGAATCIANHGSKAQKAQYLPKLDAGEWTGAMALTEAHAVPTRDHAYARAASRRRQLSDHRHEDLHHVRRSRPDRQQHPSGAREVARCAGRYARDFAIHRAQVSRRR